MSTETASAISPEVLELIKLMQQSNQENLIAAIHELRKPDEATAAKLLQESERDKANVLRKVEAAKKEDQGRKRTQALCGHVLPNGKTRLRGQRNSNGWIQATCGACQYLSEPFPATEHERDGGVNMSDWGSNALAVVNSRILSAKASGFTPPPVPEVPFGAMITF